MVGRDRRARRCAADGPAVRPYLKAGISGHALNVILLSRIAHPGEPEDDLQHFRLLTTHAFPQVIPPPMKNPSNQISNAVVFTRNSRAAIQTIPMPPPGPDEIQIRTELSTISAGTEGWIYRNLFTWSPTPFPCVPGYQRTGFITALGKNVRRFRIGERVMAIAGDWKGKVSSFWGSHLSLANSPAACVFRIPRGVDPMDASSAVVAQVGYNAAHRATFRPKSWVLVYGDGLIGQSAAQAARARGFRVIVVGHRPERLRIAAKYSADAVINSHTHHVEKTARRFTGGKPVSAVLDSIQGESVQEQYVPLLEPGRGEIVYCGFSQAKTWANMAVLQQKELATLFVAGWTRPRMEATLALMAKKKMRVRPMVTHVVPWQRAPEMYEMIRLKTERFLGITLDWTR